MDKPTRLFALSVYPAIDTTIYLDTFAPAQELDGTNAHSEPGGKGANIAAALTAQGYPCGCIALVGRQNAPLYLNRLEQLGVECIPVFTDGAVRENLSLETPQGQYRVMRSGFTAGEAEFQMLKAQIQGRVHQGDIVFVGGKLPDGFRTAWLVQLCQCIHTAGAKVSLDTAALSLHEISAIQPLWMKPNRLELEQITGMHCASLEECLSAGKLLLEHGVQQVLLSMDRAGAIYLDAQQALYAQAPSVAVKSAVGAGDNMRARFAVCRIQGMPCTEALRYAVAAGSAACLQYGTKPPQEQAVQLSRLESVLGEK